MEAPHNGLVRLNENEDLLVAVSNVLSVSLVDFLLRDRAAFAFFRSGRPRWVVLTTPEGAQSEKEVVTVTDAWGPGLTSIKDNEDFQRLFGPQLAREAILQWDW